MGKYKAKPIEIDGHRFPSRLEGKRYLELKEMVQNGKIKDLELQPVFLLVPSFKKNDKTYRKIEYIADFRYYDIEKDKIIIEDTKGVETDVFKIKHKLFEYQYPDLELSIIKK